MPRFVLIIYRPSYPVCQTDKPFARLQLASLFRIPLNILVVVTLLLGVNSAREKVLLVCSGLLLCTSLVAVVVLVPRARDAAARALIHRKRDLISERSAL